MNLRKYFVTGVVLSIPLAGIAQDRDSKSAGILLLAHGGKQDWNEEVTKLAKQVDRTIPVEVAFGMATRRNIQEAIDRLARRGAHEIVAVPLFVSSHSSVITATQYLLGLRSEAPPELALYAKMRHDHGGHSSAHADSASTDPTTPVKSPLPIRMTAALDRHPLVAEILLSRARSLSNDPAQEVVIVVAHGPVSDEENAKWLADMGALAERVRSESAFRRIEYLTVRDDAPQAVRDRATAELRALVERAGREGYRALVVPLLISYGGIEAGIRKRLEGLSYEMSPQALLPDDRLAQWVLLAAQNSTPSAAGPAPRVNANQRDRAETRSRRTPLRGSVSDPDGAPVAGAMVQALPSLETTFTNEQGEFALDAPTPGPLTLRATSKYFEPAQAAVLVPQTGSAEVSLRFTQIRAALTSVEVVGESTEAVLAKPGSVFLLTRQELRDSHPMDANELMRQIPGVVINDNSGPVAMRLNIGIRGLNPDRSRTVLMLEDGLPITLAPYGEPETYYSPPIDRMSHVEVVKGSGQILYGPQTVGGVINFVTPDPPARTHAEFDLQGGQRGFFAGNGLVGGSSQDQKVGWLFNFLHKRGDGFRDFFFDIDDLQGKFTLKPADAHTISLKMGHYDENSNSTYLGLTTPMFLVDPNQNPVPSDFLKVTRLSASASHSMAVNPNLVWSSALFGYATTRDWARADFDRAALAGRQYWSVFGDTSVQGGAILIRNTALNRNRQFQVFGAQSGVSAQHQLSGIRNLLDAGIRYIGERMDDQQLEGSTFDARTGALRDDEDRDGQAFSAYIQNRFFLTSRLTFTPGIRLEHYDYERHILRAVVGGAATNVNRRADDGVTEAIPGLAVAFQVAQRVSLFGGVHRGFAPPRVKDSITSAGQPLNLDAELSWNYEAGVRVQAHRVVRGELTYFRMDFENQIIPAAQSGGATTTLVNGGETLHQGVETSLRVDWGSVLGRSSALYTDVRFMHLANAKFTRNTLFGGNRLPYAPKNTFSFLVGYRPRHGFGAQLDATYVGSQFADNSQTVTPSADGTIGLVPSYTLWNLNADYTVQRERFQFRPYFSVKNLGDRIYIASRAPQGIQPGLFRQVNVGIRFGF
ncbi:MAG: TonB-dependent receptor [Bryobacterales bacterium]|nr:TonB-dependent receptor [Bryobacterales bacterium]